jgi:TfoX/Sxy family transcriptional regulator of competence genes
MAYDADLAERIRELLLDEPGITEKRMFGGLAFLADGHLAIAASREGGVLVRVDPAESDRLVARTGARHAVMRGRPMDAWLRVDIDKLRTKRQLAAWVSRGATSARAVCPDKPEPRRRRQG